MEKVEAVSMEAALQQAEPSASGTKCRDVPWKSVAEFRFVFQSLFGKNATDKTRKAALTEMRQWGLRCCRLGNMMLATSTLLEVQLKDSDNLKSIRLENSELLIMYACSIMRFFSFVSSTPRVHKMRSMYDIASELKIDRFIVDVRNTCADSVVLPPLKELRRSVEYCLNWLRDYYWLPQAATIDVDMASMRQKVGKSLAGLCENYDMAYECYVARALNPEHMMKCLKGNCLEIVTEWFSPFVKDLDELATINGNMEDIADIFSEGLSKMVAFYAAVDNSSLYIRIQMAIDAAQELFRMLAKHDIIETYFRRLMKMAEGCAGEIDRRAGASFWAHKILQGYMALCVYRKYQKYHKLSLWDKPFIDVSARKMFPESLRKTLIYGGVNLKYTLFFANTPHRPWIWTIKLEHLRRHLSLMSTFTVHIVKDLLKIVDPELTEYQIGLINQHIDARFKSREINEMQNSVDDLSFNTTLERWICSVAGDGPQSLCELGPLPSK